MLADLNPLGGGPGLPERPMNEILTLATILLRAEEAWEPVLFGGMIPIIGALAVLY